MDWFTFVAAVLSSTVLGSLISTVLDNRSERNQAREDRHTKNVDAARDALAVLRSVYQSGVQAELHLRENEFDAAIGKCDSESILAAAGRYREVGRRYSSGDPDLSKLAEERAYDELQSAMNRRTRRFRP